METAAIERPPSKLALPVVVAKALGSMVRQGSVWLWYESKYWLRLFQYTSRRFLRVEAYLALAGAFAFFSVILFQNQVGTLRDFLEYSYLYFSAVMILLAMNLLPRERDEETLEILWSQPMSRSVLLVFQLLTLTVWMSLLAGIVTLFFTRFMAYDETLWPYFVLVITSTFCVGSLTVLVSTYCRHAIATGLVTMLLVGAHYFWLRSLGPIEVYMNPIPVPGSKEPLALFNLIFNRVVVLFLIGFILDYLFRRLRRTAEWFT